MELSNTNVYKLFWKSSLNMALPKKIPRFEKSQKGDERRRMRSAGYSLVKDVRSFVTWYPSRLATYRWNCCLYYAKAYLATIYPEQAYV